MYNERSVVLPASTSEASAVLGEAAERGVTIVPRGAGLGWIPLDGDVIVDMSRMDQVTEHAAGDLVARIQAGATMGHVARVLADAGQRLALDVPGGVTVGGMIATGLAGPLRFRYGSPRDLLIGITVVRPDGVVAHSGGKVVKNVAGYDLGKLFAGSHGTLGLITEATFRLHPLPQAVAYLTARPERGGLAATVIMAANSPLQPSAVELGPDGAVCVLLEGTASGVEERVKQMAELLGSAEVPAEVPVQVSPAPPSWWGKLPDPVGTVVRVTFWLARLGDVLGAIASAGVPCEVGGSAGAGMLYVCLDSGTDVGPLVSAVRAAAGDRGTVVVLTDPPGFTDPLMRAVRDQFDPGHRMGGRGLCRSRRRCER
ncbi:MAG TPA: FAD-binding oxidoreductase [Streptosporangiaceae bacterium]